MDSAMARANRSGDDSELADGLTRREHDILAFERQWWKYAGAKEEAIKELFAMSATALLPSAQCVGRPARGISRRSDAGETTPSAAGQPAEGTGRATAGLRAHLRFCLLTGRRCGFCRTPGYSDVNE